MAINEFGEEVKPDEAKGFVATGWLCPRCGKINSPFTTQCNCESDYTLTVAPGTWVYPCIPGQYFYTVKG